jgi:ribonucleoside-diphosphate reductase alpha chain
MKKALDFFGGDELRARIFWEKYALRNEKGNVLEETPEDMWRRILSALGLNNNPDFWWLLSDFRFVPGGRILHAVGNEFQKCTCFNCYFIPIKEDSIEAIYNCAKEMARTYSYGGGVGIDISCLRPAGAEVRNTARYSTGAVSFMELYSLTTGTIGQHFRRGALMITIEDWHPDVLDFVKIKRNLTNVRYANISVKISDEFMEAVKRGRKWWLRFEGEGFKVEKKIDARELMDEIVKSAHGWAEPGVIFWSTMKRNSNSEYFHPLLGTNPCSEIGLPAYGACNLAAINLYKFVKNPFTEHAYFDFEEFKKAVRLGVRFLDAVIDYANAKNKYPLEAQRETENRERRLGLGIMGLADMFFALGLRYDSEEAVEFAERIFTTMRDTAYDESINLAIEKGPFPAFDWEGYSQSEFIKRLPKQLRERIKKHGIRNVTLLTIAPTGSIGTMAGVSTGIEPIFQVKYYRRSESLSQKEFEVFHPTVNDYFKVTGKKELPPHLVTAHEIDPIMRVEMQATIQTAGIDNAISSTVNLPRDISPKAVEDIYFEAWKRGCKGITVYREGSREDILRTEKEKSEPRRARFVRPASLNAEVFKYQTEAGNVYITVSKDAEGKVREVFINIGKSGSTTAALGEALGRVLSVSLQYDVPPQELIQQLRLIRSGSWQRQADGTVVFSVPDAVGRALAKACGEPENGNQLIAEEIQKEEPAEIPQIDGMACPECGGIMIRLGGCSACASCSYTRCD